MIWQRCWRCILGSARAAAPTGTAMEEAGGGGHGTEQRRAPAIAPAGPPAPRPWSAKPRGARSGAPLLRPGQPIRSSLALEGGREVRREGGREGGILGQGRRGRRRWTQSGPRQAGKDQDCGTDFAVNLKPRGFKFRLKDAIWTRKKSLSCSPHGEIKCELSRPWYKAKRECGGLCLISPSAMRLCGAPSGFCRTARACGLEGALIRVFPGTPATYLINRRSLARRICHHRHDAYQCTVSQSTPYGKTYVPNGAPYRKRSGILHPRASALRNQIQATNVSVQTVPGKWFLEFDFAA